MEEVGSVPELTVEVSTADECSVIVDAGDAEVSLLCEASDVVDSEADKDELATEEEVLEFDEVEAVVVVVLGSDTREVSASSSSLKNSSRNGVS